MIGNAQNSAKIAWRVASVAVLVAVAFGVALATLGPMRKTIPYLVKLDSGTGNIEVLQTFDNRLIGRQELMDKYWARRYVLAREQYNWWNVGADFDMVSRLTDPKILPEYTAQYEGPKALDKQFGDFTERRLKILSIVPSPMVADQMVVRFERQTVSKGAIVESPTQFVVYLNYRYDPKAAGAEVDLIANPMGYKVFSYRRDVEQTSSVVTESTSANSAQ